MESLQTRVNMDHIICDVCCCIPLIHVQTFHVVNPPFSPDFWRKILGHLHGLRRLRPSDGYMPDLISPLTLTTDESVRTPGGSYCEWLQSKCRPYICTCAGGVGCVDLVPKKCLELDDIIFAPENGPPEQRMVFRKIHFSMQCLPAKRSDSS